MSGHKQRRKPRNAVRSTDSGPSRAGMELRHLRYFVAVARHLSFRHAASELGIAQPALSQQIVALERALGARLFERTSRSVALTNPGQIFLREAELTLRQAERAQRLAERAGRGEVGAIVVAYAGSVLYAGLLTAALFEFHRKHVAVSIEVVELGIEEQLTAIDEGTIDVGFLRLPLAECPESVEVLPLFSEPIVMAMREDCPKATSSSVAVREFHDQPLISSQTSKVGILSQVLAATTKAGFMPTIIRAKHFGAIVSLVSAGLGMAMVPKSAEILELPGIVYRPITGLEESQVAVAYRKQAGEPVVSAFLSIVSAQASARRDPSQPERRRERDRQRA